MSANKINFNRNIILVLMLFTTTIGLAQNRILSGYITDDDDGSPLIGATVSVVGTDRGTVSDIEGRYSLSISKGDILRFSYIGYNSTEVTVEDQIELSIALTIAMEQLDEIVVIGYGTQEKKVATGSIGKINSEDIEGFNVPNIQSAIDGIVSGLIVSESSGQPGTSKSILIRGISTNGDNSPLYIVDGLQVSSIDNINPNDIESVDVLKDAASGAIYGARAANGVVILTTKKGGDGKSKLTYEAFGSLSNPWKLPEMLNSEQYVDLTREKFENGRQINSLNARGFPESGAGLGTTDWMDEIFNQAYINNHSLSAAGENMFFSAEYWDQTGVIGGDKSNYRRYSVRLNSTKEINDYVSLGQNLYINRVENQSIGTNNAFGTVIADAFAYDPLTPVKSETGQYGFAQSPWVQKEYINPLSRLFLANNEGHADQIVGNAYLEIKPIENLTFRSDMGLDYSWNNFRSFVPDYNFHTAFVNIGNDVSQGYGYNESLQFENYANYNKRFGDHSIDVVAGMSYRSTRAEYSGGSTSFIPDAVKFNPNWQYIDAGQDTTDLAYGGAAVDYRLISYYGRAIYNYQGKYLLTATVRRDGSSNFGRNNRWGVFPSVSAGWIISDESFFPSNDISFLKLRTSWGVNGNDRIQPLAYASTIQNVFTYPVGVNQQLVTGAALATPPNPNIKWEESVQFDVGLETRFFNDQLSTEVDFFIKNTNDLLMAQFIPGYIGATNNPISNLGSISNKGIEATVSYQWTIGDFSLNAGMQYTAFRNNVVEVAGEAGFLNGWNWPVRNTTITRMSEGYPVGHFIGYENLGVFQDERDVFTHINREGDVLQPNAKPGDLKFADSNGDGVINNDDLTNIGNPWPDHIFGLNFKAKYKNFDLSAIFASQIGHQIYRTYERSDVTFTNYQEFWMNRSTPENPDEKYPRLISTDPNNNQRPSSFYVEDGSFLRLRNLQIGYNLPESLVKKVKLTAARFYLSGNNILTITGYNGFDPEVGTNGWILDTGIDKGYYPSNKSFGAGLRITM